MRPAHALQALYAVTWRELVHFAQQRSRLAASLVRPALWLLVFGTGFKDVLGEVEAAPYAGVVDYRIYILPGLLAMVLLFNGMQSSLSMVYDREMGMMRVLLTAPLPRAWLLACKLIAGMWLSVLQAYAFLLLAALFGVQVPLGGWLFALPALMLTALMLGALGLLLSVWIRQLENFAGTMNFVIFPMFFLSSALSPLWRSADASAQWIYRIAAANPFTHGVELIRHALYGQLAALSLVVVAGSLLLFFAAAARGYDPQRGLVRLRGAA